MHPQFTYVPLISVIFFSSRMGIVSIVIDVASGFAVLQSTTLAVLGMVSLLYLYRRVCGPSYASFLKEGEVGHGADGTGRAEWENAQPILGV